MTRPKPRSRLAAALGIVVAGALVLGACSSSSDDGADTSSTPSEETTAATAGTSETLDAAELTELTSNLPVGDQQYSTSEPAVGQVYACREGDPNAGGAITTPWISSGTFSLDDKPQVEGNVLWPNAQFTVTVSGDQREVTGNNLPLDQPSGVFPIASDSDAYEFDRNPNSIAEQNIDFSVDALPEVASDPTCVGFGAIGFLNNGVALYSALDARGDDAVANEIQDVCQGHPQSRNQYHHHWIPTCLTEDDPIDEPSPVVGWALDGFPIVGHRGEGGQVYTNADLDECHGRTGTIEVDGEMVETYHYAATYEFPYTIGCFRGASVATSGVGGAGEQAGPDTDTADTGTQTMAERAALLAAAAEQHDGHDHSQHPHG